MSEGCMVLPHSVALVNRTQYFVKEIETTLKFKIFDEIS